MTRVYLCYIKTYMKQGAAKSDKTAMILASLSPYDAPAIGTTRWTLVPNAPRSCFFSTLLRNRSGIRIGLSVESEGSEARRDARYWDQEKTLVRHHYGFFWGLITFDGRGFKSVKIGVSTPGRAKVRGWGDPSV